MSSKILKAFGHLVVGKKRAAEEAVAAKSPRRKFGPLVVGSATKGDSNTPAANSVAIPANPSLKQIEEVLKQSPSYVTLFVGQEFARPDVAIRTKALQLYIKFAPAAFPKEPAKAQAIIDRCQAFLDKGADPARETNMTRAQIARSKQVGLDVSKEPGAASVKPATKPGGGKLAK